MPFDAGTIMARMGLDTAGFKAGITGVTKDARSAIGSLVNLGTVLRGTVAASLAFASFRMADAGGRLIDMERAFNRMAEAAGTSGAEVRSEVLKITGALTSREIMRAANTLEVLGIGIQHLPRMLEIARAAAIAFGSDAGFMLESIAIGTARQSRLILDNLGILVDIDRANREYASTLGKTSKQLSEAEQRQAFLNAVLAQGQTIIDRVGSASESAAEQTGTLRAELSGFIDELKKVLAHETGLKSFFATASRGWREWLEAINENIEAQKEASKLPVSIGRLGPSAFFKGVGLGRLVTGPVSIGVSRGRETFVGPRMTPEEEFRNLLRPRPSDRELVRPRRRTISPEREALEDRLAAFWTLVNRPQDIQAAMDVLAQAIDPVDQKANQLATSIGEVWEEMRGGEQIAMSLGQSFSSFFETLMVDSARAGRVFAATLLDSLGNVAAGFGQFFIQTGTALKGILGLSPFATIVAGLALMALSGMLRGLGGRQTPAIAGPHISERTLRERETIQGGIQFIVQGDFLGDRVWIQRLIEQIRIAQRNHKVEVVFAG